MTQTSAEARWQELSADVSGLLTRAEKYATLTLPAVFPMESHRTNNAELQYDWQSIGARGVNSLANKLALTMFPPARPFFRLEITDPKITKAIGASPEAKAEIDNIMAEVERKSIRAFEGVKSSRAQILQALKLLIVTGNAAVEFEKDALLVYSLRHFRVRRNIKGAPVEVMLAIPTTVGGLTAELAQFAKSADQNAKVTLYKHFQWSNGRWRLTQSLDGTPLPAKYSGTYTERSMPVRILTWELAPQEDYGTGHVEQNVGDLAVLSTLSQSEVDMALLAAQFRWLANPAGQTRPEDFQNSENGACLPGAEGDISMVSASRAAELQQIAMSISARVQALSQAFLLGTSITRDAERVTAEEIRMQQQELEATLGGTYSRLGQELQYWVARWAVDMADEALKKAKLDPVIITGLDGLSRNMEADQLRGFLRDVASIGSLPPQITDRLRPDAILAKLAAGWGLTASEYVTTQEEFQALQERQYQQQLALQQAGTQADPSAQPTQ